MGGAWVLLLLRTATFKESYFQGEVLATVVGATSRGATPKVATFEERRVVIMMGRTQRTHYWYGNAQE
jgi:hypothetical protein